MSNTFEGGWSIPFFGRKSKRTALRASHANDLVGPLNALGRMSIVRAAVDAVIYSDNNVILQLSGGTSTTPTEPPPSTGEAAVVIITEIPDPDVDYLICYKLRNGAFVNVAMPFELRSVPGDTPTPTVYPPYGVGQRLLAVKVTEQTGVTNATDWIDANIDCRRWSRYLELCNDKAAYFHCSALQNI